MQVVREIGVGVGFCAVFPDDREEEVPVVGVDLKAGRGDGRAFGPHGADLVIANSLENYDDALSREITRLTVQANHEVRGLGFKPFIAPALSSAALTVLGLIRGEWTDCSSYIGGIYFGARCRTVIDDAAAIEYETTPLPPALAERIEAAYRKLDEIAGSN